MRILAVSHPCVTDVNQQFYAELERIGHEVKLLVPANFRHEYGSGAVEVARWPAFTGALEQRRIGFANSIPLHFYPSMLRPMMRRFAPDVLYVEEEPYAVSAWQAFHASRGMRMKRIVYSAQNIVKRYPLPVRWMERYVYQRAQAAAVVSAEVGDTLMRKGYRGRLMSMPLGVDTQQFQPSSRHRSAIRAQLGIAATDFVVGYVGRFVLEKGIRLLLEACKTLDKTGIRILFVGNGPLLPEIEAVQLLHPDTVLLATTVAHHQIHEYMNAMDLLVLPSLTMPNWKEQFGRVMIESLACGVPVVGSSSGEIPRLLQETRGGWTFPEGDVAQFLDLIYNVLYKEQKRSLAAALGRRHVEQFYSKRTLAQAFAQVADSLEAVVH